MTNHDTPQTTPAPEVHATGTTEVVSPLRAWSYAEAAHKLGNITVEVVAEPGDVMTVATPNNGYRDGNVRDRGDLIGVNLDEQPTHGTKTSTITVPENRKGVVLTSPLKLGSPNLPGDRESLGDLYVLSNRLYDKHKADLRENSDS